MKTQYHMVQELMSLIEKYVDDPIKVTQMDVYDKVYEYGDMMYHKGVKGDQSLNKENP